MTASAAPPAAARQQPLTAGKALATQANPHRRQALDLTSLDKT